MAATTRNKAPARWAVLLVSGLASAGFLWGIVNTPGSAGSSNTANTDSSTALAASAPAASQQFVRRRGEDDDGISSLILPSSQGSTAVQSTQPSISTGRFRTRGS